MLHPGDPGTVIITGNVINTDQLGASGGGTLTIEGSVDNSAGSLVVSNLTIANAAARGRSGLRMVMRRGKPGECDQM